MRPLGASYGIFGVSWAPIFGLFGAFWGLCSWGPLGGLLGPPGGFRGPGVRNVRSGSPFGPPLKAVLEASRAVLEASSAVSGPLGAVLGASWAVFGPYWGPVGPCWGDPGDLLGPSWSVGKPNDDRLRTREETLKSGDSGLRGVVRGPEDTPASCLQARWGLNTSGLGGSKLTIPGPEINNSGPSKPLVFGRKTTLVKRAGHFSKAGRPL